MKKALIIVESPAKIKTLKKFLGPKYSFESSLGHIRDLPRKGFGIDIKDDFEPEYAVLEEKKEVIAKLKKAAKEAEIVYLSPDPDREGEAIAWHILSILPPKTKAKRVTFNSITKEAVLEALEHPRDIDQALVDAQQARRMLDRIVGYKISPILTRRVQGGSEGGLSAGEFSRLRLKLVVDREREIEAFKPVEYWSIYIDFQAKKNDNPFTATVITVDGKRIEKEKIEGKDVFLISNEKTAQSLVSKLNSSQFKVAEVEKKEKKRNPVAPFITSTLQQEASRHYGFSATRTMNIAQTLYEGVELGQEGAEGLITYMRTDSVRIAPEAIDCRCGTTFKKPMAKSTCRKRRESFQRRKAPRMPTKPSVLPSLELFPEKIQKYLTPDQYKLYSLIWRRFIASQMNPAIYDTVSCDIEPSQKMMLRATGSVIKFPGFFAVYEEKQDRVGEAEEKKDDETASFRRSMVGQPLTPLKITPEQSFTKPPPRFTEASLVKELERLGIGRPSTYAAIMKKIQSRDYTVKEKGTLKPTELGTVIARMLEDNFKLIMDVAFTAAMEDALEQVAENKKQWKELIAEFWKEFIPTVENAEKEAFVPKVLTDLKCPKCEHKLQKIWSRNKYFYGCSNYPDCDYTAPIEALDFNKEEYAPGFDWDQNMPQVQRPHEAPLRQIRPLPRLRDYPKCKGIVNIPKKGEPPPAKICLPAPPSAATGK